MLPRNRTAAATPLAGASKDPASHARAEYREAAIAHRTASWEGRYKVANNAFERLASVVRGLHRRGPEAQNELLALLNDDQLTVRGWAAAPILEFAPEQAEAVLEQIASGPKSLQQWCEGVAVSVKDVGNQSVYPVSDRGGGRLLGIEPIDNLSHEKVRRMQCVPRLLRF